MNQKTVLLSGLIGLVFGLLFAGTLGLDFFGTNDNDNQEENSGLVKDAEGFRVAYNLVESIYLPINGDEYYEKLENNDTFILYIGRDTCPYCQQYVPNLMDAAVSHGLSVIYHVDTIDPINETFVSTEQAYSTPTTYVVKDGVVVATIIGYKTTADTETILTNSLT